MLPSGALKDVAADRRVSFVGTGTTRSGGKSVRPRGADAGSRSRRGGVSSPRGRPCHTRLPGVALSGGFPKAKGPPAAGGRGGRLSPAAHARHVVRGREEGVGAAPTPQAGGPSCTLQGVSPHFFTHILFLFFERVLIFLSISITVALMPFSDTSNIYLGPLESVSMNCLFS